MHISEGVLSFPVISGGYLLAGAGVGLALWKLKDKDMPRTALLSSAFFVSALIHIPLGPANVHLVLNGLLGLLLGLQAFPAIMIALFMQALLFSFGGITTLGVNTLNIALPAFVAYLIFNPLLNSSRFPVFITGLLAGSFAILSSVLLMSLALALSGEHFILTAKLIFIAHIPVMIIDGLISGIVLNFLRKIKPEMLSHAK